MSQKINPVDNSHAGTFLLEALVALGDDWDKKVFPPDGIKPGVLNPEVQMLVNGVEVPYRETIHAIMSRMYEAAENYTGNAALDLIRDRNLEDVYAIRQEHERKVAQIWQEYETKLRDALGAWNSTRYED